MLINSKTDFVELEQKNVFEWKLQTSEKSM
jgi:hypothetical protein